ncbi:CorA family divalent cation transporter [Acidithiobacillus sp. IBUN Pt1247-S3]|uniref:CorA family divalent cation transporter n=1 Tax=Acidithiobacillus sp. IBUN Pt1247-S3 TaxID=3166642 RepID=UPI0034E4A8EC
MDLNPWLWTRWRTPAAMPATVPVRGAFILGADAQEGWRGYAQALGLSPAWFVAPRADELLATYGARLEQPSSGVWHLHLPYVYDLADAEQGEERLMESVLGVIVGPQSLWVLSPGEGLEAVYHDVEEMSDPDSREQALLRMVLVAIHSHDMGAQRIVQRLKELRTALRKSMTNRELREIVKLNRSMGDLVVSLRDLGHTLRTWLWELEETDQLLPIVEELQAELRRVEDGVTLVWERYTSVTNCYTGIVQNNSHSVMKVMTLWLALLMIPIALIMPFHMETHLPLGHWHFTWYFLLAYGFGASLFMAWWGRRHGFFDI